MALSLQDENLVWQKVNKALGNQSGGAVTGTAASPISQNGFRALKLQMATQKLNPQLQFVPFSYANITGASGYQPVSTSGTLYGVYAHKSGTGTTAAYFGVDDSASGDPTKRRHESYLKTTLDEVCALYPSGIAFATDFTIGVWTGGTGTTAVTGAGDVVQGFLIIGA